MFVGSRFRQFIILKWIAKTIEDHENCGIELEARAKKKKNPVEKKRAQTARTGERVCVRVGARKTI